MWVEYHKKKWKLQADERKERRKRQRIDFGDTPTNRPMTNSSKGLGGFLRRTARSIMDMPWQIVQVRQQLRYKYFHFAFYVMMFLSCSLPDVEMFSSFVKIIQKALQVYFPFVQYFLHTESP